MPFKFHVHWDDRCLLAIVVYADLNYSFRLPACFIDLSRVQDKSYDLLPANDSTSPSSLSSSPPLNSAALKTLDAFDYLVDIHLKDYHPALTTHEQATRSH